MFGTTLVGTRSLSFARCRSGWRRGDGILPRLYNKYSITLNCCWSEVRSMRTAVAFVVASWLPAILPAWQMAQAPNRTGLSSYIFVCCLIYLLQAVVGIPAFLIFFRKVNDQLWAYLLVGFLGAAIPIAIAVVIKEDGLFTLVFAVVYMGILGSLTALFFWLVARPDQRRTAH